MQIFKEREEGKWADDRNDWSYLHTVYTYVDSLINMLNTFTVFSAL